MPGLYWILRNLYFFSNSVARTSALSQIRLIYGNLLATRSGGAGIYIWGLSPLPLLFHTLILHFPSLFLLPSLLAPSLPFPSLALFLPLSPALRSNPDGLGSNVVYTLP